MIKKYTYTFIIIITIFKSINGESEIKDSKLNKEENNKNPRESKQLLFAYNHDGNKYYEVNYDISKNFPPSTSLLVDHNYDENDKINNYAYQGGVNTVSSGYNYYDQTNKDIIKLTDVYDSKNVDMNTSVNETQNAGDDSMISITTDKSIETTTKMTREGKEYSFSSGSGVSSDSVASNTNSVSNSYKYPYPYPGSTDTGSTSNGYYYYHDDKNYWQTAPPAITSEKPMAGSTVLECHPSSPMPGVFSEIFRVTGLAKVSILKALLTGALVLLVLKIPALLILKAIIFKVVLLPLGAISVLLPVILPLAYLWPNVASALGIATTTTTTTAAPAPAAQNNPPAAPAAASGQQPAAAAAPAATRSGKNLKDGMDVPTGQFETRAMPLINSRNIQEIIGNFVNSERCLERIACKLGARDSKSTYRKHVSWALKRLQSAVDENLRRPLRLYRDAYNLGSSKQDICDKGYYPCEIPKLTLTQNSRTYRII